LRDASSDEYDISQELHYFDKKQLCIIWIMIRRAFCLLAFIVTITVIGMAQVTGLNPDANNVINSVDSAGYKMSGTGKGQPESDSIKKTVMIINKTDTVYVYVKRSFNFFRFFKKDSMSTPKLLLRPYVENGMYFFKNSVLKESYATQSVYYYAFGFQIGHPQTFKIIPFTQMSFSKYTIDKILYKNTTSDSCFSMKQVVVGMILPVFTVHDSYFRIKLGYSVSFIKESLHSINENHIGLQVGLGIERKFIGNSRMYTDFSYLYQKCKNAEFKDFDMTRLAFGFVL